MAEQPSLSSPVSCASPEHEQEREIKLDSGMPTRGCHPFPVVDRGGSAGSIGAAQNLFSTLPEDTGITETKEARQSLRESEERLMAIFENAAVGQSELDLQGRFIRVNDELCRILHRTRAELLALDVAAITHPEDLAGCAAALRDVAETGQRRSLDKRYLRPDGTVVHASSSLTRIGISPGQPMTILAVTTDLTQRVETVAALERSRVELMQALREASLARAVAEQADQTKNRFLAMLSHELRTPLTPVLMTVQMMLEDPALTAQMRESMEMIERNILLETFLIDDLLDISRITHGKMEITPRPMNLHDAIARAVDVCLSDIQSRGQHLVLQLEAVQNALVGDFYRLQQVFWNLLKNASKFTPENGTITVRSTSTSGHIQVEVIDDGMGICEEALPFIFNPFAQASHITKKFGGLGLGLAISSATVNAHHGTLQASSPGEGKGATFTVTLPL